MTSKSSFTSYDTKNPENHREFNSDFLRDPKGSLDKKALQKAKVTLVDQDKDGYFEIKKSDLPKVLQTQAAKPPRLASYFSDSQQTSSENRLHGLKGSLREATHHHNFVKARDYFTRLAKNSDNPLLTVAETLARHLSASAKHAGVNVEDQVALENQNGFSVARDGRLRFDCGVFAQLAHSDLRNIPGLQVQYITLSANNDLHLPALANSSSLISSSHLPFDLIENSYSHSRGAVRRGHSSQFISPRGIRRVTGSSRAIPDLSFDFKTPKPKKADTSGRHAILLVSDQNGHHLLIDNNKVRYFEGEKPLDKIKEWYQKDYSFFYKSDRFDGSEVKF